MDKAKFSLIWRSFTVLTIALLGLSLKSSGQDTDAKVVRTQEYVLSAAAKAAGIDGRFTAVLSIDKSGKVRDVKLVAGPMWPCGTDPKEELEEVRDGVAKNLLLVEFSPQIKDSKAVKSEITIKFAIGKTYEREMRRREAEEAERNGTGPLIERGTLNGKALSLPKPVFPKLAQTLGRSQSVGGSVQVQVLIDEAGNVVAAGPLDGPELFQTSARDAACKARFAPTVLKGKPATVSGIITYNFAP